MGRKIGLWALLMLAFALGMGGIGGACLVWAAAETPPEINGTAAVVIEQTSGKVLYNKSMNEKRYPASTTKVMTALLALENLKLDEKITLPQDFVNVGEASLGLLPGAKQTVEELLMALMLRSANDAGQAIAIGVSGSEEAFVELMNQRAAELGLTGTHFMNPHGLHNDEHYTTAYDLAMIARVAMDNEDFRRIVKTSQFTVKRLNGGEDFEVYNRNSLLDQYQFADGIKNGYTRQAGNCLVGSATRDGMQLIVVVMNSNDVYTDSQKLLEWGFANYSQTLLVDAAAVKGSVKVLNGGRSALDVLTEKPIYSIMSEGDSRELTESLNLPVSVTAPVHRGEIIGSVTYTDARGYTYSTNLLAAKDIGRYNLKLVVRQSFQGVWQVFVVPFQ